MYLKKRGTVLISTIIILALMTTLGCLIFEMMRNNNELRSVYEFDKDIYDLDKDEEEVLYKGMQELNDKYKENQLNEAESMFLNDFDIEIDDDSSLNYKAQDDKIFLNTKNRNDRIRKREILYIFKKDEIILIPTYKFMNEDE
ncbi:hypothetical protein CDLVIII_3151 [Clostridium sp. DL-VIII]|uniref:hypothetical protein n=1 Tax=Clostridium sp. DL-VIII TaxID=641107 RepID=UPI00023AFF2F|nr:hypothetical protein [Clostridium sp. DL-VIII]EHI99727.1 hypothetical protein CDLVIII_3151 [Clostridium sp. DL-VIII]